MAARFFSRLTRGEAAEKLRGKSTVGVDCRPPSGQDQAMDSAMILVLVMASGLQDLPPHLELLVQDDGWWERLADTPENQLTAEQREVIEAILGPGTQF